MGEEEDKLGTLVKGLCAAGRKMAKEGKTPVCIHIILAKSPWNRPVEVLLYISESSTTADQPVLSITF